MASSANLCYQSIALFCFLCLMGILQAVDPASGEENIMCVQCTPADPRCESGNLEPTACSESHRFCGMYRVFMGNAQGVFRGCSRHWLRGCRRRVIGKQDSMVCYHSCSWSGCNSGFGSTGSYLL